MSESIPKDTGGPLSFLFDGPYEQISFLRSDGRIYLHPPGLPVIQASLRFDPNPVIGAEVICNRHWALLDTGATDNYAPPSLLTSATVPGVAKSTIRSATSIIETVAHEGDILLPNAEKQFHTHIFAMPLLEHDPYKLIIGNLIIKRCRLIMDSQSNVYRLYMNNS